MKGILAGALPALALFGLALAHGFFGSLSDAAGLAAPPHSLDAARDSARIFGVTAPRVVVRDPRPGEPTSGPFVLARPFFPATVVIPPWVVRHWPESAVAGAVSHEVAHLAVGLAGRDREIAADEWAVRAVGCGAVVASLAREPIDIAPREIDDTHPSARERLNHLVGKGLCDSREAVGLMAGHRASDREDTVLPPESRMRQNLP